MPKIKYLTEDKSGKKLRRNVPAALRELAGQSAWVERVDGSTDEIRKRANLFAVETDGQIDSLRSRLISARELEAEPPENRSRFRIRLSEIDARRLTLMYFQSVEKDRMLSRFYSTGRGWTEHERAEVVADAAADYGEALRAAEGVVRANEPDPNQRTIQFAISLLVDAQFVTEDAFEMRETGRFNKKLVRVVPQELMDNQNFELLCRYLQDADVELSRQWLEYLQTGNRPKMQPPTFMDALVAIDRQGSTPSQRSRTIKDLIEAFEAAKEKEGVSSSRKFQFQIVTRSLVEELGEDFPLEDVTRKHCEDLLELFVRVPSHATQHYPGMTLSAAADAYEKDKGQSAARYDAAQKNLAILKLIFQYAVAQDWNEFDPTNKVSLTIPLKERRLQARNRGYEPFTLSELTKIFSSPLYKGCVNDEHGYDKLGPNIVKRHRYWVPLVGLYSGMRAGEILQLETRDIITKSGVAYFDVTDDPKQDGLNVEKQLKNENARREVPVHPELERLGFVDWVHAQPKGRLFPEARAGDNKKLSDRFSKWFNNYLQKCGVWVPRKKVFHSFRGTFADRLKNAGVPLDKREAIMGWEAAGKMDARYGEGFSIEALSEEMQKTTYPDLDLSFLYPSSDALGD